jgi:hypothetical protein
MIWDAAAVIVALAALVFAISEGRRNLRHDRLSVRPKLLLSLQVLHKQPSVLILSNAGLGPAVIREVQVGLDGEPLRHLEPDQYLELMRSVLDGVVPGDVTYGYPASVMQSGESIELMSVDVSRFVAVHQMLGEFVRRLRRVELRIEYESLYGEKQVLDRNVFAFSVKAAAASLKMD